MSEQEEMSPSRRKMMAKLAKRRGETVPTPIASESTRVEVEPIEEPIEVSADEEVQEISPSRRKMMAKLAKRSGKPIESSKPIAAKKTPTKKPVAARKVMAPIADNHPFVRGVTKPASSESGVSSSRKGSIIVDPMPRRSFISWLGVGWLAFTGATGGFFAMIGRYLFPNVLFEPPQTFKAGFPEDYSIGLVDLRWKERFATWIVRDEEKIYALSTICTHLGCTPNWLKNEAKFKCPCHGSGFRISGIHFEGPAPRPLERFRVVLADDGQILIDKTKKFQYEKGEWSDPESFLTV